MIEKRTILVILKALIQILFYIDRLRHHIPEANESKTLEKSRQQLYAEIRRLEE